MQTLCRAPLEAHSDAHQSLCHHQLMCVAEKYNGPLVLVDGLLILLSSYFGVTRKGFVLMTIF